LDEKFAPKSFRTVRPCPHGEISCNAEGYSFQSGWEKAFLYQYEMIYGPGKQGSLGPHTNLFRTTGFTLLEVIVTLTILGFIVLIVFGAFRLGLSSWERGESTREDYQKVRTVTQMISRQIKSIVPYKVKSKKAEGDYLAFEGKVRSLKFVSAFPIKAKQPEGLVYGIYEFKEEGKEGGRLILYEQRVLNKDLFEETPKEELGATLIEGISKIRFEYYREGDPEKNRTEGWVEEWDTKEEKELPKALRMTLTFKNGKEEGKELSMKLLASIAANRFEDTKTPTVGLGRRAILNRLRGTN
jgi:general secretion pathway protein J